MSLLVNWRATALALAAALLPGGAAPAGAAEPGAVYNITLVTDSTPDLTDLQSYLRSITAQYATPQEQAIAIWRWSQRLRKQTSNAQEDGHWVLDPILLFNSYGHCNCGIISGVNNALWLNMGWQARYVQLGDHTVCECSWDGGQSWHMFDASMSFYCFNDQGAVASVREIEKNPRYYLENFPPELGTNPVEGPQDHRGWRAASDFPVHYQRSLANGWDSFKPPNDISAYNLYAQWGRRYVLNLRAGESYTRHFTTLPDGGPGTFRPVNGKDMDAHQTLRANGVWRYAPDLKNPATRALVYADERVRWTGAGVAGPGALVFKIAAANVVTSAKLTMQGTGMNAAISRDTGINWQSVGTGPGTTELRELVAGLTEYLIKVELPPDGLLSSLVVETITQLNRPALPRLVRGPNRVQVRLGPQVETIQFQPSVVNSNHQRTAFAAEGIDVNRDLGFYKPTLRPAEKGAPCFVTWKIATPTPITDLVYGGTVCVKSSRDRVTLLHSWDNANYQADYQKTNDAAPWDRMVNAAVTNVPAGARAAYLRYEFQTAQNAKSYSGPGIQTATMTVHHQPRTTHFVPIEVTYCWVEHRDGGDVERQHTELAATPNHAYTINVGGYRDPTMKWMRMNLAGQGPEGANSKPGYSDGQDVGPGAKAPWVRYQWGKNLARGKTYTLEGRQDERNPDVGSDLTDGIIAPPDTYVSLKYMPTYVMFAKDVAPVATLDLGGAQTVAALRVHTGQEGGFKMSYPDAITVETSTDGKNFTPAGRVGFKQVFEPPADYVPWEQEESLLFKGLPAGGRLACAYRVIFDRPISARYLRVRCAPRAGWGMMISEIQAFDSVRVDNQVPPLVAHP